jgi:hypothetical protein
MRRFESGRSIGLAFVIVILSGVFAFAQQAAREQGGQERGRQGGGNAGAARASNAPAFLKVEWVRPSTQTGQVPVVQENVVDQNVEIKWYGAAAKHLLTSGTPGSESTPFSVWSGECDGPFAIAFRQKNSFVDLSGAGRIRWIVKTSGFHVVRPVVKLADGTMLIGDRVDASVPMLASREFAVSDVRWIKLDATRIVTVNSGPSPNNEIWVPNPDLTRVDEVGFADLMPGSGHGTGGYIHLGTIEVFGKAVPRATTPASSR